jgi:hypothetical protein
MYLFGYAKALFDLDKKKHKKSIRRLLDWCDTLDLQLVRLDLVSIVKEMYDE